MRPLPPLLSRVPLLVFLVACGLEDPVPATVSVLPGEVVIDAVEARWPLSVIVRDASGGTIRDAAADWSSSDPSIASVSGIGVVTAHAPGTVTVRARVGAAEGSATVRVEPRASEVRLEGGAQQRAPAGEELPTPIRVRLLDRLGEPIVGAAVRFVPLHGGEAIPADAETDVEGMAETRWRLGPEPGTQALAVRTGDRDVAFLLASAENEEGRVPFRIRLRFLTPVSQPVRAAFERAASRWESLLLEKLAPVLVRVGEGRCGEHAPAIDEIVDDLLIFVTVRAEPDADDVVALSTPCFLREAGMLPIVGRVELEGMAPERLLEVEVLEPLVTHEIAHVLGLGSLWAHLDLLEDPSLPDQPGVDTHFTGSGARAAFDDVGGLEYSGARVPVENVEGGAGTRDRHWREAVFGDELMTGFVRVGGDNALSVVTLASLEDLGYTVDRTGADPFVLPAAALHPFAEHAARGPTLRIRERTPREPIRVLGSDGRLHPASPPR